MRQDCEMIKNFQGSDSEIADSIKSNKKFLKIILLKKKIFFFSF